MISSSIKNGLSRQSGRRMTRSLTTRTPVAAKPSTPLSEGAAKIRGTTTTTPQKPPPPMSANADWANPPDVTVEVTPQMKMNNAILATALLGFVSGIWYYSMNAVGSQESVSGGASDDPLAQLKLEAQEAMDRQEKELKPEEKTKQLLQEFTRGEHDPDKAELDALEELEAEEAAANKKKKWYKFW